MYRTLCQIPTLREAWKQVRRNGAARGGDGETRARFERCLNRRLAALADDLRNRRYHPGPLRIVPMKRPDGRIRELRIPGLADRVVQTACHRLLSGRLDARMSADSYGYRPARSVAQALARLRALGQGGAWVLDADIEAFFDRVPHARLLDDLGIWVEDAAVLRLIGLWLDGFGSGVGLAQGAPISPLLANLALHPLDMAFARAGIPYVRYADDFVALASSRKGVRAAQDLSATTLSRWGLSLHAGKTRIIAPGEPFTFLGETVVLAVGNRGFTRRRVVDRRTH